MLLLSLAFSNCPSLCQSSSSEQAAAPVERMIKAQIDYDYVSLDRLEKQLSELNKPAPKLDRQAKSDRNQACIDADKLLQEYTFMIYPNLAPSNQMHQATSKEEQLAKFRQYAGALRKGRGICGQLLETDLKLGMLDTLKDDCYAGLSSTSSHSSLSVVCWYWLGLTYAVEGDNNKSVACFTIGLRNSGSKNVTPDDQNFGPLGRHIIQSDGSTTFYPAAYHNVQQAQKEIQAEQNDRDKLKYGG